MDHICSAIKWMWEEASQGKTQIILAAWASNAALKAVARVTQACQMIDHSTLFKKYTLKLRHLDVFLRPTPDVAPDHKIFLMGSGLTTGMMALESFKSSRQHDERLMSGRLFEKPDEHITLAQDYFDGPRQTEAEHISMDLMLKTMKQLMNADPIACAADMNPLLAEVQAYSQSKDVPLGPSLVFGMQLLVESFKSYKFCEYATTNANCHTLALKFVMEVKNALLSILDNQKLMGCRCEKCGGQDFALTLISLQLQLELYLKEVRFDLYYQTPWVAGHHILEVWSLATDFGLQLCDRTKYLAGVLHLYNLLIQVKALQEKGPILESLCEVLKETIFLGSRPTMKYYTHFTRCIGGHIDFKNSTDMEVTVGAYATLADSKQQMTQSGV